MQHLTTRECPMHRLLVLACSKRKVAAAGLLPAIDRYDGPTFRVLRKYLRELEGGAPSILILSAKYGLIPSDQQIPDYDCRLTRASARALNPQVLLAAEGALRTKKWCSVGICAGKDYQVALEGVPELVPNGVRVDVIAGGQGPRLTALRRWLSQGD